MRALVCGAAGFIGTNLVAYLERKGHKVVGADRNPCKGGVVIDLRNYFQTTLLFERYGPFDEVYQLAAEMGGMGFIHNHPGRIVRNSMAINASMARAIREFNIPRFFFSSSVCVYPDMEMGAMQLSEEDAYPAHPDNEYGWEKLMAEILYLAHTDYTQVRIARFQNTYGPHCDWLSERAKAPAALCRKALQASTGGNIEVWGDGKAVRSYTHISDLLEGIWILMHSDERRPTNIGSSQLVTVDELAKQVIGDRDLSIVHVPGPQGVRYRDFSKERIHALGWRETVPLVDGIRTLSGWILRKQLGLQED